MLPHILLLCMQSHTGPLHKPPRLLSLQVCVALSEMWGRATLSSKGREGEGNFFFFCSKIQRSGLYRVDTGQTDALGLSLQHSGALALWGSSSGCSIRVLHSAMPVVYQHVGSFSQSDAISYLIYYVSQLTQIHFLCFYFSNSGL